MALANTAVLLAMWGKRVLVVEWDLEAPGIEHFLAQGKELDSLQRRDGLIDLLTEASEISHRNVSEPAWTRLVIEKRLDGVRNSISILTAGARTQSYFQGVRKLDVKKFYEDQNGGHIIEGLRNSWKSMFDFVLVDSRTGITDIGGICTIQLPDILVLVFTATEQSLVGAVDVAKKAASERQKLPFDRSLVPCLPIPSRFDTQTEHKIARHWLQRFEKALEPLYRQWLPKDVDRRAFLELSKIPYTPYFSFGEGLPVLEQGTTDPTGLGFAYETLAALIGNRLHQTELLLRSRDTFVQLARSTERPPENSSRDLQTGAVLAIDFVKPSSLVKQDSAELLGRFHMFLSDWGPESFSFFSTGDGAMLTFSEPQEAVNCALQIAETLAVRKPIVGRSGQLRIRMGIATAQIAEPSDTRDEVLGVAARIASKANAGQILISGEARELTSSTPEGIRFDETSEVVELGMHDGPVRLEVLYEVSKVVPVTLTQQEREFLSVQDPKSKSGGGFQAFLVGLQQRVDKKTGRLELTLADRERIARYAHDYKGGGWQGRLRKIFGRALGRGLGRETLQSDLPQVEK